MGETENEKESTPYAGRWVARVRGKIVSQGKTAEQASQSARQIRPKEVPEIVFIPASTQNLDNPIFTIILDLLAPDQDIYLVGGAVRDYLSQRETHDLDFVVSTGGIKTARLVAKALDGAFYALDKKNDVGRVIIINDDLARDILDFASFRGKTIESDLSARDFSINAMAYNLRTRQLLDPTAGAADLRGGKIRACSETSLINDPVRILRAVRFAADLGFSINKETGKLIKKSVELLKQTSPERIRDELFKILGGPKPSAAIKSLDLLGALTYVLPETLELKGVEQPPPHGLDVWNHTLKAVDYLEAILDVLEPGYDNQKTNELLTGILSMKLGRYRNQFHDHLKQQPGSDRSPRSLLFFATLFHDIAKPDKAENIDGRIRFHGHDEEGALIAARRAIKLRLSNAEIDRIKTVVQNHMRIINHISHFQREGKIPTRRALYRFFRDTESAGIDLCLLALADQRATYVNEMTQQIWKDDIDIVRIFLQNWWEKREESISPPPLVNGDEIMADLKIKPGPDIGKILEGIRESQAVGQITSRDEALQYARAWLLEHSS